MIHSYLGHDIIVIQKQIMDNASLNKVISEKGTSAFYTLHQ
jgi:hypothetical protein